MENQVPLTNMPPESSAETPKAPERRSPISSVVIIVILVVALLAAGYLYILSLKGREAGSPSATSTAASAASADETSSIEADLNEINIENSDQGLDSIDSSFRP